MKMNMKIVIALSSATMLIAGIAAAGEKPPLQVVPKVDLTKYAGTWYEVARLPNRFQKKCVGEVTADYEIQNDGRISVLNQCTVAGGSKIKAKGVAKPAGKNLPASQLKVRFAPAFLSFLPQVWGDYNIIALDSDYRHSLVGSQSRDYLWILARTPTLDDASYMRLVDVAREQGFNVSQLEKTQQR